MGVGTFGTDGELFYEIDVVPANGAIDPLTLPSLPLAEGEIQG